MITNLPPMTRLFAYAFYLAYKADGSTLTDLTNFTPAFTAVNEFGVTQAGVTFSKGSYSFGGGSQNLRVTVAEGAALTGNQLRIKLSLTSSGDDVYLGEYVIGIN